MSRRSFIEEVAAITPEQIDATFGAKVAVAEPRTFERWCVFGPDGEPRALMRKGSTQRDAIEFEAYANDTYGSCHNVRRVLVTLAPSGEAPRDAD